MLTQSQNRSPAALGPKPGPRQIAPKKNTLVKQQKMTRVRLPSLSFHFIGFYRNRKWTENPRNL